MKKTNFSAFGTLITIFFFWGFVAASNDILIPVFKKALKFQRFKMPSLTVEIEQEIIRNIYNLRKNKEQH